MPTNETLMQFISKSKVGGAKAPPIFYLSINVPALLISGHIWDPCLVPFLVSCLPSFLYNVWFNFEYNVGYRFWYNVWQSFRGCKIMKWGLQLQPLIHNPTLMGYHQLGEIAHSTIKNKHSCICLIFVRTDVRSKRHLNHT